MKDLFKAYYITCSLLEDFEGVHAMIAEEDLFNDSVRFTKGKLSLEDFGEKIDFLFGLNKKNIVKAVKNYEKYKKESE